MAFLVLSVYSIHTACQELTMDVQYEYVFWLSFFGIVFGVVFLPITNFTTHIKFSKLILGTCTRYMYVWNMYSFGVQHQVHVLSTLHVTGFQAFNWTMQQNGFITFNAGSFVYCTTQFRLAQSNVYHANCIEQLAVVQLLYMYSPGNNDDLLSSWKMQMVIAQCLDLYGWDFIIKVLSRS